MKKIILLSCVIALSLLLPTYVFATGDVNNDSDAANYEGYDENAVKEVAPWIGDYEKRISDETVKGFQRMKEEAVARANREEEKRKETEERIAREESRRKNMEILEEARNKSNNNDDDDNDDDDDDSDDYNATPSEDQDYDPSSWYQ